MSRKKQTVRLGSYARLSRDDGEDGVSNSIVNQQQIMRQYCERHAGLAIVREYADDGFSGTTSSRPDGPASCSGAAEARRTRPPPLRAPARHLHKSPSHASGIGADGGLAAFSQGRSACASRMRDGLQAG